MIDRPLEQNEQKKILAKMIKEHFHAVKVIVASKNGEADILACDKQLNGRFWAIEVKRDTEEVLKPLQEAKLDLVLEAGGIAFCAYGYQDFILKYKMIRAGWTDFRSFFLPLKTFQNRPL